MSALWLSSGRSLSLPSLQRGTMDNQANLVCDPKLASHTIMQEQAAHWSSSWNALPMPMCAHVIRGAGMLCPPKQGGAARVMVEEAEARLD